MLGKVLQSKVEPLQITETDHTNSYIKPSHPTINGHIIDVVEQHDSPIESDPISLTSRNIMELSMIPVQGQLETTSETNHGLDPVVLTSSYITLDIEQSIGLTSEPSLAPMNDKLETNSDIEPPNTIEVAGLCQGTESTILQ
mgnify:CR=1